MPVRRRVPHEGVEDIDAIVIGSPRILGHEQQAEPVADVQALRTQRPIVGNEGKGDDVVDIHRDGRGARVHDVARRDRREGQREPLHRLAEAAVTGYLYVE